MTRHQIRNCLMGRASAGLYVTACLAGLLANPAYAQDAGAAGKDTPPATENRASSSADGEIIVTARRREERLQDVPAAITAVNGAELQRYAVSNLFEASSLVPDLIVGRQTTGSSVNIFLRGVGSASLSSGFDQSVSLNLDGVPMTRGREILASQFDLDRIEVLKGPQALFYGRNATGGIISITTANPTREFEASARGGYDFVSDKAYGEAMISGPIANDFGARLAVRASRASGWFINTAPAITTTTASGTIVRPGAQTEKLPQERDINARLTLRYDPSADFNITLKGSLSSLRDKGNMGRNQIICAVGRTTPLPVLGIPNTGADCSIDRYVTRGSMPPIFLTNTTDGYFRDGNPFTRNDSQFLSLTGNYNSGIVNFTSVTGYYHYKYSDLNNFDGTPSQVFTAQATDYSAFSQELRALINEGGKVSALVGGFYSSTDLDYGVDTRSFDLPPDPLTGRYDSWGWRSGTKGKVYSAFAEITLNLIPTVEIAGGARYTKETKDSFVSNVFVHSAIATSFPLKTLTDKFSDDNVSPQVTVTWKPSRDLTVYAAHREGYKSGGFNNSFIITAASVQGDGRFGSEDATGNEIGVKGALFDRRMHFDLAIYDYKIKNLQVNIYDPVARASVVTNAGALKTRGIDLSGSFAVSDGFNLRGNVAYNEAKYRNYIGLCYTGQTIAEGCDQDFNTSTANFRSQDFDGRTAPRAPRWSGRFGGSFEQPVSDNLTFSLDGDMSFSSKYYYMDTLRPDGVQKGFTRYDAGIRLRNEEKGWEVALIGRNLTNKLVATGGQDVTSQGSGTGTAGPGVRPDINAVIDQPRQIMLEFGLKF